MSSAPTTTPAAGRAQATRFVPEIQGLRTVALLLVATFHIWVGRVSGGVDIFLLISAYLLTRSITAASERGVRPVPFTYIVKKFARLLPLAATTIVLIVIAAWLLMPTSTIGATIGDSFASLFYYQNFHLQAQSVDYYANTHGSASLLQHYWSLSIQGQVFILWPILHLVGHVISVKSGARVRTVLGVIFGIIFVASLAWSVYWTGENQTVAYFDTFARLWEFAAGSLLALITLPERMPTWLRATMSWVGLAGVISCGLVLPVESTFPGFAALWPVVSAALIIAAAGTPTKFGADRLLATPVLTTIGGYTYALYLVHWPVLVLFLNLTGQERANFWEGLVLLLISGALSFIITRLVERPTARFLHRAPKPTAGERPSRKTWQTLQRPVVVLAVGVLVGGGVIATSELIREQRMVVQQASLDTADLGMLGANAPDMRITDTPLPDGAVLTDQDIFGGTPCEDYTIGKGSKEVCMEVFATPDAPTVYFVGNSHSERFTNIAFETADRTVPMNVRSHAAPGCAFDYVDDPAADNACQQLWTIALDYIEDEQPEAVAVMATMSTTGSGDETFPELPAWIERVHEVSPETDVIAIRDTPRFDEVPYDCAIANGWDSPDCVNTYTRSNIDDYIAEVSSSGGVWVDVNDGICPDGVCKPQTGGLVTYYDTNHLTAPYMRSLAQIFASQVSEGVDWWPQQVFG